MEPTEDVTPLRTMIPDHTWFPCPHCGRAIKCPPVARPKNPATTALTRRTPGAPVAPELEPDVDRQATTEILRQHPNPAPGT